MEPIAFKPEPHSVTQGNGRVIYNFDIEFSTNIDTATVESFGEEWTKFNHFSDQEIEAIASEHYFDIVKPEWIENKQVLDVGCGTGRWTKFVAKRALRVDAVDPSKAIEIASMLLFDCDNVRLSRASVDNLPFADSNFDFVFSLGVLHHIPDTQLAMQQCVNKLKPGGYFLVYLYYRFDNKGSWFKLIFYLSNYVRKVISGLREPVKNTLCDILAVIVYLPLIFTGWCFKKVGLKAVARQIPLHFYVGKTFNVIRNDARDRFGTPLEQRFTKDEIRRMMERSGLTDIIFSEQEPYWHAIGKKK
ncbi:MAG: class I SAM-dependent methyltransferase [Mucilaginibacter sp.]|uniref:class I SAM-dependent methyltransferase n=1 Tax=Mucilaginibacter sp. L3T2-6 TaxID=3062491 RepID=UPI002675D229|nr:class I SAM-dependent methyltransferase [Mucilaginibacter sp. L3T2-6]MDO3642237.1 class I SAM-dependent methyltransferase [Mucilaginibacter sp. L3T2-6]MDV6214732.1 class I SAM-dependent methyltransferase [Mucilaginibacter sp. L3T2-6]